MKVKQEYAKIQAKNRVCSQQNRKIGMNKRTQKLMSGKIRSSEMFGGENVSQLYRILTMVFWGIVSVARRQRSVRAISGPPSGHKSNQASPRLASTLQQMARR